MYLIAITNTFVTMGSTDIIEIIKDLMALTIISDFDDFFAHACGDVLTRQLCTDNRYSKLLTVDVTTSKDAMPGEGWLKHRDRVLAPCPIHEWSVKNMREFVEEYDLQLGKEFKEEDYRLNRSKTIRIDFSSRSLQNKVFVAIYRCFRFFNVTLWTYYLPIIALILQFAIPVFREKSSAHSTHDHVETE